MRTTTRRCGLAVMAMMVALFLAGCRSPGAVSLVDIDLRTPEQILADKAPANMAQPKDVVAIWDLILKALSVVKGRIRVLTVEWGCTPVESQADMEALPADDEAPAGN